jgi:hypothetical protein
MHNIVQYNARKISKIINVACGGVFYTKNQEKKVCLLVSYCSHALESAAVKALKKR